MGAGGRRFKSSRPDHLKQGLGGFPLGPFLLWVTPEVTNEGQMGINLPSLYNRLSLLLNIHDSRGKFG